MKTRTKIIIGLLLGLPVLLLAAMIGMGITPLALGMHSPIQAKDGIAAGGLDVVSLVRGEAHTKGTPEHTHAWKGANWLFANAENKAAFIASPNAFAPQCGGHCAFAATKGFAAPGKHDSYAVQVGKLYFFAEPDVKASALEDPAALERACGQFHQRTRNGRELIVTDASSSRASRAIADRV